MIVPAQDLSQFRFNRTNHANRALDAISSRALS